MKVHIAYLAQGGIDPIEQPRIGYHRLGHGSNYDPGLVLQVARLLRIAKPDMVQSWILQLDVIVAPGLDLVSPGRLSSTSSTACIAFATV